MPVILALLGSIITLLILINRLKENGIDIGWLNPFSWFRRRQWAKQYNAKAIHSISSPMELTALLMVALAKSEGDLSSQQKHKIKQLFQSEFKLDEEQATSLFQSSVFMLKDEIDPLQNLNRLIQPSKNNFSEQQACSALDLLTQISNLEGPENQIQQKTLTKFKAEFLSENKPGEWT